MSDVKRLKAELTVIWEALLEEEEERAPELSRRERAERARSALLSLVDEAIQEISRP